MKALNHSDLRLLLQRILPDETMEPLQVALARIIAAKPQSVDVERLISTYNKKQMGEAVLLQKHFSNICTLQ